MKWYYAKPGNIEDRGLVEREELEAMARDGRLRADDLVRGEKREKWIRASDVSELIPQTEAKPKAKAPEQAPRPEKSKAKPADDRRHSISEESSRSSSPTKEKKKGKTKDVSNGDVRKRIRGDISKKKSKSFHHTGSWILFILLGGAAGFLRYSNILDSNILSYIQTYGPYLIIAFHILVTIKAFTDSLFHGILCIFIPLYSAYYLFLVSDAFYMRAVVGGLLVGSAQDTAMFIYEQFDLTVSKINNFIQTERESVR